MAYDDEPPNSIGQVDVAKDSDIAQQLSELRFNPPSDEELLSWETLSMGNLPGASDLGPPFETVFSVDGSRVEVLVGDRRRNKRVGFINIALSELDMTALQGQEKRAYVNPVEVEHLGKNRHIRMVLPSSNTLFECGTTHESWRRMTYRNFRQTALLGQSLFDMYYTLLERSGRLSRNNRLRLEICPAQDCTHEQLFVNSTRPDSCPECGTVTYPTDALRVHERVTGSQSNVAALNVLMGIIEHMVLLRACQYLYETEPERLETTAFIKDGPLAQFDTAAWIHEPILHVINDVQTFLSQAERAPLVYAGIHKTGEFVAFGQGIRDDLGGPCVLPFNNESIYEYVMPGDRSKDYGYKTYYGKNFLFKSAKGTDSGHCIPFLIPRRYEAGVKNGDIVQNPEAYPELARTVTIIEQLRTIQYPDALIPLVLAHSAASLPEDLSRKVLGKLTELVAGESEEE
ncbi:hypothetical protein C2R22_02485 [Salinigranum rubrum]|uniref:NurA domain-containing protein n=1 Tax=Salinigranum rubrum TaxID=755307 RepID=A0A2I8VFF0_9EURY|nr:hypothetical protein [Salinigranum rubrum]AUV80660.1 hypothetical protein C2R22_02485 [Salinigranum rubrum]